MQGHCHSQYEELLRRCGAAHSTLEASIRTDMDQIIASKEHVTSKIKGAVGSSPPHTPLAECLDLL